MEICLNSNRQRPQNGPADAGESPRRTNTLDTELSAEPSVLSAATISSRPTEKGLADITPFSEYFGLLYIDRKPLRDFYLGNDRTMFIRMVEAERLGLITLFIDPPCAVAGSPGTSYL